MTNLLGYLGMDVAAMTANDWAGVIFVLTAFVGMIAAYYMVFRPANKDRFESLGSMALEDENHISMGEER